MLSPEFPFKGLKKLKKTNIHIHLYKFILSVKQSTAENFVYGELGGRPCQFRFGQNSGID